LKLIDCLDIYVPQIETAFKSSSRIKKFHGQEFINYRLALKLLDYDDEKDEWFLKKENNLSSLSVEKS